MSYKFSAIFVFLVTCQICFAARISREINDQSVKYETIQVEAGISNVTIPVETKNVNGTAQLKGNSTKVETVKSDVSPEESSPEETLEEAAESLSKILTEKEKVKFNQILNEFKKAKTLNETVDGFLKLFEFVVNADAIHSESNKTKPADAIPVINNTI